MRKCERCDSTMAAGRPRVRRGRQLWCQTCAKNVEAPSGRYRPGTDIQSTASSWYAEGCKPGIHEIDGKGIGDYPCGNPDCPHLPCDDEWCVKNEPEHTRAEHIDPPHRDPGHEDYQSAEHAINEALGEHAWLLDGNHEGPSHLSSKTAQRVHHVTVYVHTGHQHARQTEAKPAIALCDDHLWKLRHDLDDVNQKMLDASDESNQYHRPVYGWRARDAHDGTCIACTRDAINDALKTAHRQDGEPWPGNADALEHLRKQHGIDKPLDMAMRDDVRNRPEEVQKSMRKGDGLDPIMDYMNEAGRRVHEHEHGGDPRRFPAPDGHVHDGIDAEPIENTDHLKKQVDVHSPFWRKFKPDAGGSAGPQFSGGPRPLHAIDHSDLANFPNRDRDPSHRGNMADCPHTYDTAERDKSLAHSNEARDKEKAHEDATGEFKYHRPDPDALCPNCGAYKWLHTPKEYVEQHQDRMENLPKRTVPFEPLRQSLNGRRPSRPRPTQMPLHPFTPHPDDPNQCVDCNNPRDNRHHDDTVQGWQPRLPRPLSSANWEYDDFPAEPPRGRELADQIAGGSRVETLRAHLRDHTMGKGHGLVRDVPYGDLPTIEDASESDLDAIHALDHKVLTEPHWDGEATGHSPWHHIHGSRKTAVWSYAQHPQPIVHIMGRRPPRPLQTGDTLMHPDSGFSTKIIAHTDSLLQCDHQRTPVHRAPMQGDFSKSIWHNDGVDEHLEQAMNVGTPEEQEFLKSNPDGPRDFKRRASLEDDDYRMAHRPPDADHGAPAHDLTGNGVYPDDVYTHPEWYGTGEDDHDRESFHQVRRAKGRPDAKVRVYRSVPAEHAHKPLTPGDWVSTSPSYARQHGKHETDPQRDWPVLRYTVQANEIHTDGNSINEWGYNGDRTRSGIPVYKGGYHQEVRQHADGVVRPVQRRQSMRVVATAPSGWPRNGDYPTDEDREHYKARAAANPAPKVYPPKLVQATSSREHGTTYRRVEHGEPEYDQRGSFHDPSPYDEYHGPYRVIQHPDTGKFHVVDNQNRLTDFGGRNGSDEQHLAEASRDYCDHRQASKEMARGIAERIWNGAHEVLDPGGTDESRRSERNMQSASDLLNHYQPQHIKHDEDERPYAEAQHRSGYTARDYGGNTIHIHHAATGEDEHDLVHVEGGTDSDFFTPGKKPEGFGHADLSRELNHWVGENGQYAQHHDPRIPRWQRRRGYTASLTIDAFLREAVHGTTPRGEDPAEPTLWWRSPNGDTEVHVKPWMPDRDLRENYGAKPHRDVVLHHVDTSNPNARPAIRRLDSDGSVAPVDQFGNHYPKPPKHVMKHLTDAHQYVQSTADSYADVHGQAAEQNDIRSDLDRVPRDMEAERRAHEMFRNLLNKTRDDDDDDPLRSQGSADDPDFEYERALHELVEHLRKENPHLPADVLADAIDKHVPKHAPGTFEREMEDRTKDSGDHTKEGRFLVLDEVRALGAQVIAEQAKDPRFNGVTVDEDDDGFYVRTHRARSKSYRTPEAIPQKDVDFIESTGAKTIDGFLREASDA